MACNIHYKVSIHTYQWWRVYRCTKFTLTQFPVSSLELIVYFLVDTASLYRIHLVEEEHLYQRAL